MIKAWEFPEPIARSCGGEVYAQAYADTYYLFSVFPDAKKITSREHGVKKLTCFQADSKIQNIYR